MSKRVKWSTIGGLILMVLVALPFGVEYGAERLAESKLAGQPFDVEWQEVSWSWTDDFTFRGVTVNHPSNPPLEMESVTGDLAVGSLVTGAVEVQKVEIEGLSGQIDVDELKGEKREGGGEGASGSAGFKWGLLDRVGEFEVRDFVVGAQREGVELGSLTGTVSGAIGSKKLSGSGKLSTSKPYGGEIYDWSLEGVIDPSARAIAGRVGLAGKSDAGDGAAADVEIGNVSFGADTLSFQWVEGANPGMVFGVGSPVLRLEGDGGAAVVISGSSVRVAPPRNGRRLAVVADEMRISIAPFLVADELGLGQAPDSDAEGPEESSAGSRGLVNRFVSDVDFDLREAHLRMRFRNDGVWKTMKPADSVRLRKVGRQLVATGKFAGGRVVGVSEWEPGFEIPTAASLKLSRVNLEKVPIVRQGRSLPSRGVRGKVGGKVDLEATMVRTGLPGMLRETITGLLDVEWQDGWVNAGGLAKESVRGIDTSWHTAVDWEPRLNRLLMRDSRLSYGPVRVDLSGRVTDWPFEPELDFKAEFAEFKCQEAIRALPKRLLGPYEKVAIEGKAKPVLTLDFPVEHPEKLEMDLDGFPHECHVTALNTTEEGWPEIEVSQNPILSIDTVPTASESSTRHYAAPPEPADPIGDPVDLEPIPEGWGVGRPDDVFWLRKPFVMRVTEGVSEEAEVEVGPGLGTYIPIEALPKHVAGAAYMSEEINFYDDGAWNIHLIQKALQLNFGEDRFVYGGSTVTQQLVKNLFLSRDKTLARKIQEALIAWRIQGVVSKDRILELYLNCIELGNDLYGIGPAARHYFQKSASELSILEGVFLAVIKPAPWFGDRFREKGTTPESGWWHERIAQIMERLVQKGFITDGEAEEAKPYVLKWDEKGNPIEVEEEPKKPEESPDDEESSEDDDG